LRLQAAPGIPGSILLNACSFTSLGTLEPGAQRAEVVGSAGSWGPSRQGGCPARRFV